MKKFILMDFIHFGNVGIEEDYIYIIGGLVTIIFLSFCVKPIINWAIRFRFSKFLSYLISSIFTLLVVVQLSFLIESVNEIEVMKITLQSVSLYGIIFTLLILLKQFIRRTS